MAKKEQRLTDALNLALSQAMSCVSIGKDSPDKAARCCELAEKAIHEAFELMSAIRNTAGRI